MSSNSKKENSAHSGNSAPNNPSSNGGDHHKVVLVEDPEEDLRRDRLVDWITDIFSDHLNKVVAHRDSEKGFVPPKDLIYHPQDGCTTLDEVAEVIFLPKLDAKGIHYFLCSCSHHCCCSVVTIVAVRGCMN